MADQSWHAPGHRGQPGSFLHLPCWRPSVPGPQRRKPAQRTSLQRHDGAGPTRGNNSDWLSRTTSTGTLIIVTLFRSLAVFGSVCFKDGWSLFMHDFEFCFLINTLDINHHLLIYSNAFGWSHVLFSSHSREPVLPPRAKLLGLLLEPSGHRLHPPQQRPSSEPASSGLTYME